MKEPWAIEGQFHNYVTLTYDGRFIFCLDNSTMYAEEMIYRIEKRTGMKFRDIPVIGDKDGFQGWTFFNGGWRRDFWNEFPPDWEITAYMNIKRGIINEAQA